MQEHSDRHSRASTFVASYALGLLQVAKYLCEKVTVYKVHTMIGAVLSKPEVGNMNLHCSNECHN